jgi:hypothetical protein
MNEIKSDLKEIKSDVVDIKLTLAVNTASLKEHMTRTSLAEVRITKVENWVLGLLTSILISLLAVLGATIFKG